MSPTKVEYHLGVRGPLLGPGRGALHFVLSAIAAVTEAAIQFHNGVGASRDNSSLATLSKCLVSCPGFDEPEAFEPFLRLDYRFLEDAHVGADRGRDCFDGTRVVHERAERHRRGLRHAGVFTRAFPFHYAERARRPVRRRGEHERQDVPTEVRVESFERERLDHFQRFRHDVF